MLNHIKKLKKEFKETLNFENLKHYLKKKGYEVQLYKKETPIELIKILHKEETAKTKDSFTATNGNTNYIFVNQSLKEDDRILCLLHEYFHFEGGHLSKVEKSTVTQECEADTFAYMVTHSKELFGHKKETLKNYIIMCLCVLLCCTLFLKVPYKVADDAPTNIQAAENIPIKENVTKVINSEHQEEPVTKKRVYVTKSGKKFHEADCRYLNSSAVEIELSEASERYDPCKVCNPVNN